MSVSFTRRSALGAAAAALLILPGCALLQTRAQYHTLSRDYERENEVASVAAGEASEALSVEVQHALQALPDEFRTAVVLCDVVGLSYDEISEAQGIPVGTVRSRIHRGRRLLRTALS